MFSKILYATAVVFYFPLMVTLSLLEASQSCDPLQLSFDQNMEGNHRLTSHVIESQPISKPVECFIKCLENCRCVSYNVCNGGQLCELNSEREENVTSLFEKSDHCDYHDFDLHERLSKNCRDPCCSTSQPCLNGTRCRASCMENGKRFQCLECPDGHTGDHCEKLPRSCASYSQSSNRTSGLRLVYAPNNTPYYVFCYFGSLYSLTLVMSYSRDNIKTFRNKALTKDFPVSENSPNWVKYRLSYSRMAGLRDKAHRWRISCMYDKTGIGDEKNMLRASFDSVDPLVFHNPTHGYCKRVKIGIHGSECNNCIVSLVQGVNLLHVSADKNYCENGWAKIPDKKCNNGKIARYFGNYADCYDPQFPCTSTGDATTQLWFISVPP